MLERRRKAAVEYKVGGVCGSSSHDTTFVLWGGDGSLSRTTPLLSEITDSPGVGGNVSSTAIAGIFVPNVAFFLK